MLTDIFAARYADRPIWQEFRDADRVLLVQGSRIVAEQLFQAGTNGKHGPLAEHGWQLVQSKLSMELGLESLSPLFWSYTDPQNKWQSGLYSMDQVCRAWMLAEFKGPSPDTFMKQRISLIELAFRERMSQVQQEVADAALKRKVAKAAPAAADANKLMQAFYPVQGSLADMATFIAEGTARAFHTSGDELNERFKQAKLPLSYHAGFIQIATDPVVEEKISKPFWSVIADPRWKNVEIDMTEALDRRETAQRDPALYAAKALESALKIICKEKGWLTGNERGASNFIDNLRSSKNGSFIVEWEAEALKHYFSKVRNALGHGPGGEPMPQPSQQQNDWAIEAAMSWTKTLIGRM